MEGFFKLRTSRHCVAYFKGGVPVHFGFHNYGIAENIAVNRFYGAGHRPVQTFGNAEHYAQPSYDFYIVFGEYISVTRPVVIIYIFLFLTSSGKCGKNHIPVRHAVQIGV